MNYLGEYPIEIVQAYQQGKITRQEFCHRFGLWQQARGMNFDVKGFCTQEGLFLKYRGFVGKVKGIVVELGNAHAFGVNAFCRLVDHKLIAGNQWNKK